MEVLSDLENANILGHILAHHEDFDDNPKAYTTFFTKVTSFKGSYPIPVEDVTPQKRRCTYSLVELSDSCQNFILSYLKRSLNI
jgi:hypothetical protein